MKKKMAEGLLAVGMVVLLLAGCSGTGNEEGTQAAGDGADAGRQEEDNMAPGQEEGDDGSETGNTAKGASDVDETTLTMATTFSETEFAGQVISYFKDYLSEHSDGKINLLGRHLCQFFRGAVICKLRGSGYECTESE